MNAECDSIQFKIISIKMERSPYGQVEIEFTTAEDSILNGTLTIEISNRYLNNKSTIKAYMYDRYLSYIKSLQKKYNEQVKVGDII